MPLKDNAVQGSSSRTHSPQQVIFWFWDHSLRRGCNRICRARPWDGAGCCRARALAVRQRLVQASDTAVSRRLQPGQRNRNEPCWQQERTLLRTGRSHRAHHTSSQLQSQDRPRSHQLPLVCDLCPYPGSLVPKKIPLPSNNLSPLAARKQFIQTSL